MSYAQPLAKRDVAFHRETIAEYPRGRALILAALAAKHGRIEDDLRAELASEVEAE